MDQREEQLRQRAYDIWKAEGEPHGRDRDHWETAERELRDAPAESTGDMAESEARPAAIPVDDTSAAPATIQDDGVTAKARTRKPRTRKA